jgi:hypothetical protein
VRGVKKEETDKAKLKSKENKRNSCGSSKLFFVPYRPFAPYRQIPALKRPLAPLIRTETLSPNNKSPQLQPNKIIPDVFTASLQPVQRVTQSFW